MNEQNLKAELASLRRMSPGDLRDKYQEVFGEPSRSGNKDFLCKRIAWRIQAREEGGLSERARQRALELARDADIRTTIPRMPRTTDGETRPTSPPPVTGKMVATPGTVITRQYHGKTIEVNVLADGTFEYDGLAYRSLTAVAKAVTGTHWNGRLFFGLNAGKEQ